MDGLYQHSDIDVLRLQLNDVLSLSTDEYDLTQEPTGEFNSTFLGVKLASAFQPIYDNEVGKLYGHEALLRPSLVNDQPTSPEFAFSFGERSSKLVQFDRISRTLHVLNFKQIYAENGLLFLNVHPNFLINVTLHGKVFERILHEHSVPTHQVVIEIREDLLAHDQQLGVAIDNYRERGYKIAIDNFANPRSHIDRLWKFSPDYVKFDQSVIAQAEHNVHLNKLLPSLVKLVYEIGAKPIITGIETKPQLDIASESGAKLLQGYFLGRPTTAKKLRASDIFKQAFDAGNLEKIASQLKVANI